MSAPSPTRPSARRMLATTLALSDYPQMAGTASSLLGMVRFGFGGIAAPFVGVAGALSILPLGITTATAVLLAAASCLLLPRRGAHPASEQDAAEPALLHPATKGRA